MQGGVLYATATPCAPRWFWRASSKMQEGCCLLPTSLLAAILLALIEASWLLVASHLVKLVRIDIRSYPLPFLPGGRRQAFERRKAEKLRRWYPLSLGKRRQPSPIHTPGPERRQVAVKADDLVVFELCYCLADRRETGRSAKPSLVVSWLWWTVFDLA